MCYTAASVGAWRSPGAHLHGVQGVAGSNPAAPTSFYRDRLMPSIKVRDAIRIVEADGWFLVYTRGSHRQFKHPVKAGKVTIPGKPGDDLDIWLWGKIRRQAQI